MVSESQDPVSEIEQALVRMRRDQSRGRLHRRPDHEQTPWSREPSRTGQPSSRGEPPWGTERFSEKGSSSRDDRPLTGTPDAGTPDAPPIRSPRGDGSRAPHGPHDRSLGGAARFRLLDALRIAETAGQTLSISDVADAISVDQPRASRLVNEAAERGLVTRRSDERDARRSVVQLSDAGRALLETAVATRRSAVTQAVAGFTPEETATFAALLTRFVAAWPR